MYFSYCGSLTFGTRLSLAGSLYFQCLSNHNEDLDCPVWAQSQFWGQLHFDSFFSDSVSVSAKGSSYLSLVSL